MVKIDLRWQVLQKNQLWLRWKKATKKANGDIELSSPEFFGPVLSDCIALEQQGIIYLDLTKHLIVMTPSPYIIELSWDKLISQDLEKVTFTKMTIKDSKFGMLNTLSDRDLILMDCASHTTEDESRGNYKTTFKSMIYKETMEPYAFS